MSIQRQPSSSWDPSRTTSDWRTDQIEVDTSILQGRSIVVGSIVGLVYPLPIDRLGTIRLSYVRWIPEERLTVKDTYTSAEGVALLLTLRDPSRRPILSHVPLKRLESDPVRFQRPLWLQPQLVDLRNSELLVLANVQGVAVLELTYAQP